MNGYAGQIYWVAFLLNIQWLYRVLTLLYLTERLYRSADGKYSWVNWIFVALGNKESLSPWWRCSSYVSARACVSHLHWREKSQPGGGGSRFKARCQEVNLPGMYTRSSTPTLESSALTVRHRDRARRMSVTMVTAGHRSSAATTTPHDNSNITCDTPSGNSDKHDSDGAAAVTAS